MTVFEPLPVGMVRTRVERRADRVRSFGDQARPVEPAAKIQASLVGPLPPST